MSGIGQAESDSHDHPDIGPSAQPDVGYQDAIYLVYGTRDEAPAKKDNGAWERNLRQLAKVGILGQQFGHPVATQSGAPDYRWTLVLLRVQEADRATNGDGEDFLLPQFADAVVQPGGLHF